MDTFKLLTIVIPTYNMERYLESCLNSLCIHSGFDYLDILIINDGSKDGSLEIAKNFVERYPTVVRVIDKENGNYGSCINRGLAEAKGKYIKILDADDSFSTEELERYIHYLKELDVDLIITDFVMITPEGKYMDRSKYKIPHNVEIPSIDMPSDIPLWMHSVTYKTDNLRAINYMQTEGISYTDQEWIFLPMITVKNLIYNPVVLYKYLVGREGQTVDPQVFIKNIHQEEMGLRVMLKEFYDLPVNTINRKYLVNRLLTRINIIYSAYLYKYPHILNLDKLCALDQELHTYYEIYNAADNVKIHKLIPYRYINEWRKDKSKVTPSIYKVLLKCVVLLGKLKRALC